MDDLIKKGDLNKSDRKKAVLELLEKAEKSTEVWRGKITKEAGKAHKEISGVLKKLDLVKKSDLKKVEEKVDKMAKLIKQLEKKLNT